MGFEVYAYSAHKFPTMLQTTPGFSAISSMKHFALYFNIILDILHS